MGTILLVYFSMRLRVSLQDINGYQATEEEESTNDAKAHFPLTQASFPTRYRHVCIGCTDDQRILHEQHISLHGVCCLGRRSSCVERLSALRVAS